MHTTCVKPVHEHWDQQWPPDGDQQIAGPPFHKGLPFTMDFPLSGTSLYQGLPFIMDFPLSGISFHKGFVIV